MSVHGARVRARSGVVVSLTLILAAVIGAMPSANAQAPPVIMLTGDSVPDLIKDAIKAEAMSRGWDSVSAALGACPVTGEQPAKSDGTVVHLEKDCPGVIATQDALVQQAQPEIVLWWDRFDLHIFKVGDRVIVPGTHRFWRIREKRVLAAIDRLAVDGARVVFVAVEPIGLAVSCTEKCPEFIRFHLTRYHDVTMPWNRLLRDLAASRPWKAGFVSVTTIVCHPIPVDRIPCNDRIDGVPARSDGTHYAGAGVPLVVNGLFDRLTPFTG